MKTLMSAALVAALGITQAADAAEYVLSGAELVGATNVKIAGSFYDVEFVDGTCIGLFSGCNENADFDFDDATGDLAAQALLDQVFGAGDLYDTNPEASAGLENTHYGDIWVPTHMRDANHVWAAVVRNYEDDLADSIVDPATSYVLTSHFMSNPEATYARFSPAAAPPVPVPAAAWLFGSALLGLAGWARRRNAV